MVQAVGSSIATSGFGTGASSGVLEAQLKRYQNQLADWCNCPSGKTPAGMAKIQDLQNKADAVKAQLDRIAATQAKQPSNTEQANANQASSPITAGAAASAQSVGGFLDTFA